MEENYTDIGKTFINELKGRGIENNVIPRLIKDLAYSFQIDPSVSLSEVNDRLHFLGWEDVELDYHTLQLAIASFERDQSQPGTWKTTMKISIMGEMAFIPGHFRLFPIFSSLIFWISCFPKHSPFYNVCVILLSQFFLDFDITLVLKV